MLLWAAATFEERFWGVKVEFALGRCQPRREEDVVVADDKVQGAFYRKKGRRVPREQGEDLLQGIMANVLEAVCVGQPIVVPFSAPSNGFLGVGFAVLRSDIRMNFTIEEEVRWVTPTNRPSRILGWRPSSELFQMNAA